MPFNPYAPNLQFFYLRQRYRVLNGDHYLEAFHLLAPLKEEDPPVEDDPLRGDNPLQADNPLQGTNRKLVSEKLQGLWLPGMQSKILVAY